MFGGPVEGVEGVGLAQVGYPREKAVQWWRQLGGGRDVPMTAIEAMAAQDRLTRPEAIDIRAQGRLTETIRYRFPDGRIFADARRLDDRAA